MKQRRHRKIKKIEDQSRQQVQQCNNDNQETFFYCFECKNLITLKLRNKLVVVASTKQEKTEPKTSSRKVSITRYFFFDW